MRAREHTLCGMQNRQRYCLGNLDAVDAGGKNASGVTSAFTGRK
jgi:hypothetical protein